MIGDRHAHVEISEPAFALGVDEILDVRMIATKHGHLCPAARTSGFDGLARLVENLHVRQRAARAAISAFHPCTLGANAGEVVTDAAAAPHRFRGLVEGVVDANISADTRNAVADRLHEAIDQGGLEIRSGGCVDAAARDEPVHLRAIESPRPSFTRVRSFDQRERVRYPAPDIVDVCVSGFRILLQEDILRDRLRRQGCCNEHC